MAICAGAGWYPIEVCEIYFCIFKMQNTGVYFDTLLGGCSLWYITHRVFYIKIHFEVFLSIFKYAHVFAPWWTGTPPRARIRVYKMNGSFCSQLITELFLVHLKAWSQNPWFQLKIQTIVTSKQQFPDHLQGDSSSPCFIFTLWTQGVFRISGWHFVLGAKHSEQPNADVRWGGGGQIQLTVVGLQDSVNPFCIIF